MAVKNDSSSSNLRTFLLAHADGCSAMGNKKGTLENKMFKHPNTDCWSYHLEFKISEGVMLRYLKLHYSILTYGAEYDHRQSFKKHQGIKK